MRDGTTPIRFILGLCACLILSGCYQGYGQDVNSEAELQSLLLSLTPNNSPATAVPVQPSTALPTRVPTLAPPTNTNAPIISDGGTIIHIVADGDTLFNIAQQYNVSVDFLSALNGIADPNALFVSQALIIPPTNVPALPTDSTQTSNLPTETPTPLPTATFTATYTVTASPTLTYTSIPSATLTYTSVPSATYTAIPTLPASLTPSSTAVSLSSLTPVETEETQLSVDVQAVHVVETGQTLFQISRLYDIPLETITQVNSIEDASQLAIGQELVIPSGDTIVLSVPEEADESNENIDLISADNQTSDELISIDNEPIVHTVSAGETLYQISLNYAVSLDSLVDANNIIDTNQVTVGQELAIPLATPSSLIVGDEAINQNISSVPQRIALDIPTDLNGVQVSQIVRLSPQSEATILEIYERGQALGRNPRAFSKLGDSTIENPHFLTRFDNWQGFEYNLGEYTYLEGVIDYYAGSFIRQGAAVKRGMHSWTVFDPQWADKSLCQPAESALECEFRIHNPSILLIRLGANDVGVPQAFENNMRDVVEFSIENGVIPILGTKSDRNDGAGNPNNLIIRRLAEKYELPLWDFDSLSETLPRRGLTTDNIHLTINFSHDYTDPNTFRTGHGVNNLSALMLLDVLWQTLNPDVG